MITAIYALIRKDVLLYVGDRRALLLNLLMPILLGGFFGFIFGGGGDSPVAKIDVAVVVADAHPISQKILLGLKAETSLAVKEIPLEDAKELVRKGKLGVAVFIPNGFGDAAGTALFGAQAKPELAFFYDPSQTTVLAMVKGIMTQHVMEAVSENMFSPSTANNQIDKQVADLNAISDKTPDQLALLDFLGSWKKFQGNQKQADANTNEKAARPGLSTPFTIKEQPMSADSSVTKSSAAKKYNGYSHSIAGMSVQFILFMAIDAGISILLARRLGLWNRLLASPVGLNTLLISRALSCALIAFILTGIIFSASALLFKVKILGSLAGFIGVAFSFSLMTASFGLLIAAFGKTPEAARGIATFSLLIMVMLSGAWMPAFLFPAWLQSVTLVVPTRWAIDGFDAMTWRGLDFFAVLPAIGMQLLYTILFGWLALWKFNKQQR